MDAILKKFDDYGFGVSPCSIISNHPLPLIEDKLGFRLPAQYIELMKHVGGSQCGGVYLFDLKSSCGHMILDLGGRSITCGPEHVCGLFIKKKMIIIGSNDNGLYYFIKGLRKNARDRSKSKVLAFEMDYIDEQEATDASDLICDAYEVADSLYEFIANTFIE